MALEMNLNRLIQQWEERHHDGLLTSEVFVFYLQNIAGNFVSPTPPRPEEARLDAGVQLPDLQLPDLQHAENDAHVNNIFLGGNAVFDEPGARAATVSLMERFICGSDPEEFLEKIKQTDTVSSVCGRVFKIGEPTYSCRECIHSYPKIRG
uniref:Uncharacterized protein n=1 Tax=Anopheles maculatus TaxID=74869 RepID=A0A182SCZ6_9DIPT